MIEVTVATILIFAAAMIALGIGVLLGRRPITRGSCGGDCECAEPQRRDCKNPGRASLPLLVLALVIAVPPLACTGAADIRKATYPPSFTYLERGSLRSEMWEIAARVNELESLLRSGRPIPPEMHTEVVRLLSELNGISERLGSAGLKSNHPKLDANIEHFRRDLKGALEAAQGTPPDYYLAGTITGSCGSCHDK